MQIIVEAKENKGNFAVLWLDIGNIWGLVELTLRKNHVAQKFRLLLQDNYDHFKMRFTLGDGTTQWQRLVRNSHRLHYFSDPVRSTNEFNHQV